MKDIAHIEQKLGTKFSLNKQGYYISDTHRQCTNCLKVFLITSKTVTLCNECNSTRVKSQRTEVKMYRRAKTRAKQRNLDFTLTVEDIVIPRTCPVFGFPLVCHTTSGAFNDSPSLDRIDSTKGYTKDNIQVVSQLANAMKLNASPEELVQFANWVLSTYTG